MSVLTKGEAASLALFAVSVVLTIVADYQEWRQTWFNLLLTISVASFTFVVTNVFRKRMWHLVPFGKGFDPEVLVFPDRDSSGYQRVLDALSDAKRVDMLGISLKYFIEYIRNQPYVVNDKVAKPIRVLLPADREICDERDEVQGSRVGSLADNLEDSLAMLTTIRQAAPELVRVRRFRIHPYFAIIRVDDVLMVSVYLHRTGSGCPVLRISKENSPRVFEAFLGYYDDVWNRLSSPWPPSELGSSGQSHQQGSGRASD